jgi:hypothetical protein
MNNVCRTIKKLGINAGIPCLAIYAVMLADGVAGTGHFDIISGFGFDNLLTNLGLGLAFAAGLTVIGFAVDGVLLVALCQLLDIRRPGYYLLTYGATVSGTVALRLGALALPGVAHLNGILVPLLYANLMIMLTWLIVSLFFTPKDMPMNPVRQNVRGRSGTQRLVRMVIWYGIWAVAGVLVAWDNGLLSLPLVALAAVATIGGMLGAAVAKAARLFPTSI